MKTVTSACWVWCVALLFAPAVNAEMVTRRWGQAPAVPAVGTARPSTAGLPACYVPETKAPPKLDGKLDDNAWKQAAVLHIERTLDGSARAEQPTEVRLLRDPTTLYVGVRADEPRLDMLQATARGNDAATWQDDSIEIFIGQGGTYYHLGVNAAGSTYDAKEKDDSWDSGIKAAAGKEAKAWTLEAAIPLGKMFGRGEPPVEWTANFNRNRQATGALEESAWSPTGSGNSHVPERFGKMFFSAEPAKAADREAGQAVAPTAILPCTGGEGVVRFDLASLPKGAKIYRADLLVFRASVPAATDDDALVAIEIRPLFAAFTPGTKPAVPGEPLALREPWYDRFDATDAVRQWATEKPNGGFFVQTCPRWDREATCLDIAYEGQPADVPKQAADVRAVHRAGQTFITWTGISDPLAGAAETKWARLKTVLAGLDKERRVRYRIYRHNRAITAANLFEAEPIAEVKPLSGLNVNGRSPDQAFQIMRARMLSDLDYAKDISQNRYTSPPSAYDEVVVDRFVIPGSAKPLASGTGLYVHTADKEGAAYYAVLASVDGVQNTRDITAANSLVRPVAEEPGRGEPVFQREMDMKVLFDYPGKRLQYVQWVAPPLANLPSRYFNWSAFVPRDVAYPAPIEFVLTGNEMFRRPRWPHRSDTILISPHDAPFGTLYFGYPESAGTLRSLKQGRIQPYTWRRMLAFLDWAAKELKGDKNAVTCSGDRDLSATGALHFAMRHPDVFSLVYACRGLPNPSAIPPTIKVSWQKQEVKTDAGHMEQLFGRKEWGLATDTAANVWDFFDLTKAVATQPEALRPMLSYGGRGGWGWAEIAAFLKVLADARQPVISAGAWGSVDPPGVKNPGAGRPGLTVRLNRPIPIFTEASDDYQGGRDGDGGSTNLRLWWEDASIVDDPDRFEIVITGGGTVSVTPRRLARFVIKPGEKVLYKTEQPGEYRGKLLPATAGEAVAGKLGLVTVPKIPINGKVKLTLTRSEQ